MAAAAPRRPRTALGQRGRSGGDAAGEGAAGAAVAGARAIDRDAWGVAGGITGGTGGGSGGSSGGGSGGVFFGGPRGGGSFQCAALPCSFLRSLGRANGGSDGGVKVGLKKRRCRSCVATAASSTLLGEIALEGASTVPSRREEGRSGAERASAADGAAATQM